MDIIFLVIFRTSPAYDYYFRKVLGLVYYDGSSRTFDVSFFYYPKEERHQINDYSGIWRDKTMADTFMYIPNVHTQN